MVRFALKVRILVTLNYCLTINIYSMKNRLTKFCRLISERISKCFKKSQNKKPTIVKNKMGFKLNFGFIQFERSKEWSSLSEENAIPCGDAGSSPALHSFLSVNPSYFNYIIQISPFFNIIFIALIIVTLLIIPALFSYIPIPDTITISG